MYIITMLCTCTCSFNLIISVVSRFTCTLPLQLSSLSSPSLDN